MSAFVGAGVICIINAGMSFGVSIVFKFSAFEVLSLRSHRGPELCQFESVSSQVSHWWGEKECFNIATFLSCISTTISGRSGHA